MTKAERSVLETLDEIVRSDKVRTQLLPIIERIRAELAVCTNCHCENCRRAAGAQAVAWVIVKRSDFKWETGKPHRYKTDTGAFRTFCDACGTSLTYETDRRPDEIDITAGSLDHPENFPPTKDVYPEEKLPWVDLIK
jgi:hypothetical protein